MLKSESAYFTCVRNRPEFIRHAWPNSIMCTAFRNEGSILSSTLLLEALGIVRWKWPSLPSDGLITLIDEKKIRNKQNPGYCFLKAGFKRLGYGKGGHLFLQALEEDFPELCLPLGA